jgi:hypothetical protein
VKIYAKKYEFIDGLKLEYNKKIKCKNIFFLILYYYYFKRTHKKEREPNVFKNIKINRKKQKYRK